MNKESERSFRSIVGQKTYSVWVDMLKKLVPTGRTHRLAPMIAGLMQYAYSIGEEKYGDQPDEGSVYHSLFMAAEAYSPEEVEEYLLDVQVQLFEDAGIGYRRVNSQGASYSIVENALYEYIHWYDMPWEAQSIHIH